MIKIALAALAVLSITLGGVNIIAPSWAETAPQPHYSGGDGTAG